MNRRGNDSQNKWGLINYTMKKQQIAILGLQETHPSEEMRQTIGKKLRNTLHLIHSADPDDPSKMGGVTVAINKGIVNIKDISHSVVIPGRVIMIELPWNERDKLHIMNVCAPANNANKVAFWRALQGIVEENDDLKPDVLMGDLNLVENPEMDRLNNSRGADPQAAWTAMSDLMVELNLTDGWRRRHPKKRGFTFTGNGQLRLDRIYTKEELYPWCTNWRIEHPGFKTDHNIVSVQITSENMLFIGKGRWAIPVNLLKNKTLKKRTQELARQLEMEVEQIPQQDNLTNPQIALKFSKQI